MSLTRPTSGVKGEWMWPHTQQHHLGAGLGKHLQHAAEFLGPDRVEPPRPSGRLVGAQLVGVHAARVRAVSCTSNALDSVEGVSSILQASQPLGQLPSGRERT